MKPKKTRPTLREQVAKWRAKYTYVVRINKGLAQRLSECGAPKPTLPACRHLSLTERGRTYMQSRDLVCDCGARVRVAVRGEIQAVSV